jgi:hypothetical protein
VSPFGLGFAEIPFGLVFADATVARVGMTPMIFGGG